MPVVCKTDARAVVAQVQQELGELLRTTEREIHAAGIEFKDLDHEAHTILNLAAGVVSCVEDKSLNAILPKVELLSSEARRFALERFMAGTGILETVQSEMTLLDRLAGLTAKQRSIARETQMLSLMTNIEVARMGEMGAGFEYLARQLSDFSASIVDGTKYLSNHTDERKHEIYEAKCKLTAELPHIKQLFTEIDVDLAEALSAANAGLTKLTMAPVQFHLCAEGVAGHIRRVVSAIQSHDITRQQIEHVNLALGHIHEMQLEIGDELPFAHQHAPENNPDLSQISAGLMIQIYQLRNIERTVTEWVTQIQTCAEAILTISTSEVVGISPVVLAQERTLSLQLGRISTLEHNSEKGSKGIEENLSGLSNLMQLVSEHEARSKTVRDQLQLLSFNSIIESRRLGSKASAILEISQRIKQISNAWSDITEKSASTKQGILDLVEQSHLGMSTFTESGSEALIEAQAETIAGLENLRVAAAFAGKQSLEIEAAIERLKKKIASTRAIGKSLETCFTKLSVVIKQLSKLQAALSLEHTDIMQRIDPIKLEEIFAVFYTTQMERDVFWAAVNGTPLPVADRALEGNEVELF